MATFLKFKFCFFWVKQYVAYLPELLHCADTA